MEVIKVENLSKTYDYYKKDQGVLGSAKNLLRRKKLHKEAVKNISFSVERGSIVGFVGLNGAGKTTTLKMLSGILKPTSGRVEVLGADPFDKKTEMLKQITMVMGNKSQLWWDIPAIETFELNRSIFEVNKSDYKNILEELVTNLDVGNLTNIQVRRLSLGERMKMELISALIHSPSIMFLDEPTIGLDIVSQQNIRKFLKNYNELHDTTIILTSHNFDDIVYLCDKLILIDKGEIIYNDSFESFMKVNSDKKILTIKFKSDASMIIKKLTTTDIEIIEENNDEVKMAVNERNIVELTHELTGKYFDLLKDISIENLDIKEIISRLYGNSSMRKGN